MTGDLLRIVAQKMESKNPPKDKYIIEVAHIKKIIRGYANDAFTKSVGFFTKVFGNPPLPQRCFSIYATSKMKEKIFNIKCQEEEDATDFIDNLKIVMDFMSKNKTIKNAVQFSLTYKN